MPDDPGCPGRTGAAGKIGCAGKTGCAGRTGAAGRAGAGCAGFGLPGSGTTGTGVIGGGCDGAGCAGCVGGWTGLRVCPGTFKTTIMLIIVSDSSIRTFLIFINFSGLLFVFGRANGFCHSAFRLTNYGPDRSFAMGCNPTAVRGPVQPGMLKLSFSLAGCRCFHLV